MFILHAAIQGIWVWRINRERQKETVEARFVECAYIHSSMAPHVAEL